MFVFFRFVSYMCFYVTFLTEVCAKDRYRAQLGVPDLTLAPDCRWVVTRAMPVQKSLGNKTNAKGESVGSNFRQREIFELARREGKVTVDGLAEQYEVSVQTIRRDLSELAKRGRLERVHGGAIIPSGVVNIQYEERRRLNDVGKTAIATACARSIPNGASVFMNIGTTTEAVAQALMEHENLLVVTNNLNIANILTGNQSCEIILAGGVLRRADGGIVGGLTVEMVKQFKFDISVLGCSAIDEDGDLLDYDSQEIMVTHTAFQRSRDVMIVADHHKFKRTAPLTISTLRDVDTLFTDAPLPQVLAEHCVNWGTSIVTA